MGEGFSLLMKISNLGKSLFLHLAQGVCRNPGLQTYCYNTINDLRWKYNFGETFLRARWSFRRLGFRLDKNVD